MMKLDQLPKDCRSFIASEAKKRNQPEQAVLDHYVRLIDETDAEIEKAASRLTGRGNKRTAPDRRERWHGHILRHLDKLRGVDWIAPPEVVKVIEEREGKTVDRLILDRLCVRRGWGVASPTIEQADYFRIDTEAEREWPTRCRNRHEREEAEAETRHLLMLDNSLVGGLNAEELGVLAAQFYERGDQHLGPAVGRLVRWFSTFRKRGHK